MCVHILQTDHATRREHTLQLDDELNHGKDAVVKLRSRMRESIFTKKMCKFSKAPSTDACKERR